MSTMSEAFVRIETNTTEIKADVAAMKAEVQALRCDVTALQLARARMDGQLDLMWKFATVLGLSGIVALVRTFVSTTP